MDGSSLKSAQLLELMRQHLATDAGKELTKKVGLVYQLNVAPKVRLPSSSSPSPPSRITRESLLFLPRLREIQARSTAFLTLYSCAVLCVAEDRP